MAWVWTWQKRPGMKGHWVRHIGEDSGGAYTVLQPVWPSYWWQVLTFQEMFKLRKQKPTPMDSPVEQGPVGRGDAQHGATWEAALLGKGLPGKCLQPCYTIPSVVVAWGCLGTSYASAVAVSGSLPRCVCRMVCPHGPWFLWELLCSHALKLN